MPRYKTTAIALRKIREAKEKKLTRLDLGCCGLRTIPKQVFELPWLEELSLANYKKAENLSGYEPVNKGPLNLIESIPAELASLSKLKNLNLSGYDDSNSFFRGGITELPNDCLPASLQVLDLSYNELTDIILLNHLQNLQELNLSGNQLKGIHGFEYFKKLKQLSLSKNRFSEVRGLEHLSGLQTLDLSENQLTEISGLEHLPGLQTLDLSGNQIREVPKSVYLLGLRSLDLSMNQLKSLDGIRKMTSLEFLSISYNQIADLQEILTIYSLFFLSVIGNKISSLAGLKNLTSLRLLQIDDNPLKDCPEVFVEDIHESVMLLRSWWRETAIKKNLQRNKLVKLQVLGNGGVGKSSLIEALKNGSCAKNFDSTHGVLLEMVRYPGEVEPVQFQAWDFGGQEIYHGTHKLFISSESIQLIVTDKDSEQAALNKQRIADRERKNEEIILHPLRHFIRLSRRQSPRSRIVVVQNKDNHERPLDKLINSMAAEEGLTVHRVSATTGAGIRALREVLAEEREKLLQYDMLMPKSWLALREHFERNLMRSEAGRLKLIDKKEFGDICNDYGIAPQAISAVETFLHHTGLIYSDSWLGDHIIVDQRWALEAIYKPLDRKSDFYDVMRKDFKGRVRVKVLFDAFGKKYTEDQRWLFLRFMQSCGLCFSLESNEAANSKNEEAYLVFPEFLPMSETDTINSLWGKAKAVHWYRYKFEYLDYFRIQKFITKLGTKTRHEHIWRNGIVVTTQQGMFRVEADQENAAILIGIEESAQNQWLWLIISTFIDSDEDNKGDWLIGKGGEEGLLDINTLKADFESRKDKASDSEKGPGVLQPKELPGLTDSLPDVKQDRPRRLVISYASEDIEARKLLYKTLYPLIESGRLQVLFDDKAIDGTADWPTVLQEMFQEADGYVILVSSDYQFSEKKRYISEHELPIMTRRHIEEKKFVYCIPVKPVIYSARLEPFPGFRTGNDCLPEFGHARDKYMTEFVKEVIEEKFLKLPI